MILSAHQPNYLPWLGLFEKIIRSDLFVVMDTVQYSERCFLNRNKIRTPDSWTWLSVPVIYTGKESNLRQIKINYEVDWGMKHWKSITYNYKKSKCFKKYEDFLYHYFSFEWDNLVDLNMSFINFVLDELNINTKIEYSSNNPEIQGKKSDLILSMCKAYNTALYYSGANGINYLKIKDFDEANIPIYYQNYKFPYYAQCQKGFVPSMSILDLLLNHGEDSKEILLKSQYPIIGKLKNKEVII
ncbi:WbqC family protein [Paenibacillus polymyxa]|uniref:WbqC family protein n=1 Tax=Paenibacillus polymyxa TaxID=1406 RepID=UPI002AB43BBE|nr:WbqC family protein [Paenibacillus polymyxa]MDY7989863.1 WbqC family protein [Paenibacillus polymyxa]MDY8116778.1 WbqC family protein [Paenibacillus polymyxa]